MANRSLREMQSILSRELTLSGVVTITAAGAIAAQGTMDASGTVSGGQKVTGATVTKVAATSGRYLITLDKKYKRLKCVDATMIGPDTAAFPTTTGSAPMCRQVAGTQTFMVQFVRTDTQADADPASGTKFTWTAIVGLR